MTSVGNKVTMTIGHMRTPCSSNVEVLLVTYWGTEGGKSMAFKHGLSDLLEETGWPTWETE